MIQLLEKIISELNAHLAIEGFHDGCTCRNCDSLRRVETARKAALEAYHFEKARSPLGSDPAAPTSGETQEGAGAVANGPSALAEITREEGKWFMILNGKVIASSPRLSEIVEIVTGLNHSFIFRR